MAQQPINDFSTIGNSQTVIRERFAWQSEEYAGSKCFGPFESRTLAIRNAEAILRAAGERFFVVGPIRRCTPHESCKLINSAEILALMQQSVEMEIDSSLDVCPFSISKHRLIDANRELTNLIESWADRWVLSSIWEIDASKQEERTVT
jgi:hypothetical protein